MLTHVFKEKRFKSFLQVIAIPGTLLPWCADLFSPKGGWIAIALLGIAAILLAMIIYMDISVRGENVRSAWWFRLTAADIERTEADLPLWVPRPALHSHGLHLLALFAIACLFWAQKSFAAREQGGFLAKNVDMISVAQRQLGISEQMLAEQKKTNETLASLDSKADNFKQETSGNPRKEIANLGIAWSAKAYYEAIDAADMPVLNLFHEGDMPLDFYAVNKALKSRDPRVKKLFVARASKFDPDLAGLEHFRQQSYNVWLGLAGGTSPTMGCRNMLMGAHFVLVDLSLDGGLDQYGAQNRELVRAYCRNRPSVQMARGMLENLKKDKQRDNMRIHTWEMVLGWIE